MQPVSIEVISMHLIWSSAIFHIEGSLSEKVPAAQSEVDLILLKLCLSHRYKSESSYLCTRK